MEFHETRMGHIFFEGTMVRIVEALEDISKKFDKLNDKLDKLNKITKDEPIYGEKYIG